MAKKIVREYYKLSEKNLANRNVCNMAKPVGMQFYNKPEYVTATKGSKSISAITSGKKGETFTVISCCNAKVFLLPSYCVFKRKKLKNN